MGDNGFAILCVGMLIGIASYIWGVGQYRLKKAIEYTPTSKAISVAPGVAEVSGTTQPAGGLLVSPFGGASCVYYEAKVYKWSGSGKHRKRTLAAELESDAPFYIEDDTGKVLVKMKLEQSNWGVMDPLFAGRKNMSKEMVKRDFSISGTPMAPAGFLSSNLQVRDDGIHGLLAKSYPQLSNYCDRVDIEECCFSPGEQVYLLGVAKEEELAASRKW